MDNEFSLRELEEVFLKTTYPIEIAGRKYDTGETLCVFDKIQISNFNEIKSRTTAHGGFGDRDRVFWEDTKGIDITFSQGIFNELQFALLCNAQIIYRKKEDLLLISMQEEVESDESGLVNFSKTPEGKFFVYEKESGEKIVDYEIVDEDTISIAKGYTPVILDYKYNHLGTARVLTVGQSLIKDFLRLEAKTRVKDDISGKVRTGIIQIPKLKLMSDLSMRLGKNANPVAANFKLKALPPGERENTAVMNLFFLDEDIDSDM